MSESKFCGKCGSKTYSSAKFCTDCGQSFYIPAATSETSPRTIEVKVKKKGLGKVNDTILIIAASSLFYSLDVYFNLIPKFLWITDYQTALSYASYSIFGTLFFWTILIVRLVSRKRKSDALLIVTKSEFKEGLKKRTVREL